MAHKHRPAPDDRPPTQAEQDMLTDRLAALDPPRIAQYVRDERTRLKIPDQVWEVLTNRPLRQLYKMETGEALNREELSDLFIRTQYAFLCVAIFRWECLRTWKRKYGGKRARRRVSVPTHLRKRPAPEEGNGWTETRT